jgi:hypothetical protein
MGSVGIGLLLLRTALNSPLTYGLFVHGRTRWRSLQHVTTL